MNDAYVGSSGLSIASEEIRKLADGVKYHKRTYTNHDGGRVVVYAVTVAPGSPARAAVWAAPQGQTKTVPVQVGELEATGRRVLAAANADFFKFFIEKTLETYGAQIVDGRVIREPNDSMEKYCNNWFGMTEDGEYVIADASAYHSTYKGRLACAVGGGFRLVQGGEVTLPRSSRDPSIIRDSAPDPRTCVGVSADGGFALICVDGRGEHSAGASYSDEVQLFFDLDMNITEVLNLDGGGSTAIVVRDENDLPALVNIPSSDPMRPVADVLAVVL